MARKKKAGIYAPHIPAGVIDVARLKDLARKLEQAGAGEVKLTGELIFVLGENGLSEEDKNALPFTASRYDVQGVRTVKVCSAVTYCDRNLQDVLSLALELDRKFYGVELPMKLTIGVSGCARSCSEPATKDIGLIADPRGYKVLIGGSAGMRPAVGREFARLKSREEVFALVEGVVEFCGAYGRKMVRLGRLIDEKGLDFFREAISKQG